MTIMIKFSTGKVIELTKEEFDELFISNKQNPMPYLPYVPYIPEPAYTYGPYGLPTITYQFGSGGVMDCTLSNGATVSMNDKNRGVK